MGTCEATPIAASRGSLRKQDEEGRTKGPRPIMR
jgi:hypothetical protein